MTLLTLRLEKGAGAIDFDQPILAEFQEARRNCLGEILVVADKCTDHLALLFFRQTAGDHLAVTLR